MTSRNVRILTFSTLYPSSVRSGHGIFVETRLRELLSGGEVEAKVVAPVPWFFSRSARFGEYALMARTPVREVHNGIDVEHPRYLSLPKVGMSIAPFLLALGSIAAIRRLLDDGFEFDLIDAHYFYPDGVAAAMLARYFTKPFVVTARGTDINLIPRYAIPRWLIQWAAGKARIAISVCNALRDELEALGVDRSHLLVLRNGVDLKRFHPLDQSEARRRLNAPAGPTLLSVGYLIERKGHQLAIEALTSLPRFRLVIVGTGPDQSALESRARRLGVATRVEFAGNVPQSDLYVHYSAADALVLASSREGWPNVLLESMACGTPVIATRVWGTPEVVNSPVAGRLMSERTSGAIVAAVNDLFANYPLRMEVRRYAEQFDWAETSRGQLKLFREIAAAGGGGEACADGSVFRSTSGGAISK